MALWAQEHQAILDKSQICGEDVALTDLRAQMRVQTRVKPGVFDYGAGPGFRNRLYRLPARFATVL